MYGQTLDADTQAKDKFYNDPFTVTITNTIFQMKTYTRCIQDLNRD